MVAIHSTKPDFEPKSGPDILSVQDLLELPNVKSVSVNPDGDLYFVVVNTYSCEEKKLYKRIHLYTIKPDITPFTFALGPFLEDGDAFWLDSRTIGHITASDGTQKLFAVRVLLDTQKNIALSSELVDAFPNDGSANFKYSAEGGVLVFSTYVWPDMDLRTITSQDEAFMNRGNTAMVYDDPFVRHWDIQVGPKVPTLISVSLFKSGDKWVVGDDYTAPLKGTCHETPVEPWGGNNCFDISATHIVYTCKEPQLPVAKHTKQNIYIVSLRGGEPPRVLTIGAQGATDSPVFGRGGKVVAWTEMPTDGYESDRAQVMLYDLESDMCIPLTPSWDRSATRLMFSSDGSILYITAREHTRSRIFSLPLPSSLDNPSFTTPPAPSPVLLNTTTDLHHLPNNSLLYISTSTSSPPEVYLDSKIDNMLQTTQLTFFGTDAQMKRKGKISIMERTEDFWFDGAEGKVHSFVLPPRGFRELSAEERKGRKWPVLFLIHGGPQYAWWDEWDMRWNFNVFAHQGYFVFAPNPTGSLSFGQDFTDSIHEDWGGKPFEDLKKGWKAVQEAYPEIDAQNAIAAGHSWGGFAIHWIQGHPEYEFGFKAMISEAGMFDTRYFCLATEELYFPTWDLGGSIFTDKGKAMADKFNPANFINNFSTPELLIHGSKDYRVPETEALSVFNALRARGIDSRLILYPDTNHMVSDPPNLAKAYYEILRWMAKYNSSAGSAF